MKLRGASETTLDLISSSATISRRGRAFRFCSQFSKSKINSENPKQERRISLFLTHGLFIYLFGPEQTWGSLAQPVVSVFPDVFFVSLTDCLACSGTNEFRASGLVAIDAFALLPSTVSTGQTDLLLPVFLSRKRNYHDSCHEQNYSYLQKQFRPRSHRTRSTLQKAAHMMEHIAANGSVHTAHKQHHRICLQTCLCELCCLWRRREAEPLVYPTPDRCHNPSHQPSKDQS